MNRFRSFFKQLSNKSAKIVSLAILLACAAGPYDYNEFLSYFQPESSENSRQDRRYHFTSQWMYEDDYTDTVDVAQNENLKAWASYTNNQVPEREVYNSLYAKTSKLLPAYLMRLNKAAFAYLNFAQEAEKANPPEESWMQDDTTQKVAPELAGMIKKAQESYQNTKDAFLKERYAFQAVKLAALAKDPSQAKALYDKLVKPLSKKTFISDWALCRKAGAEMMLQDTGQAIYDFAQVFDRCPSRRREADMSLRIYGLGFREEALSFCQNNREKAAVYALCAVQPNQDGLNLLKKMVELQPDNSLLELIMAREINKNEFYFNTEKPTEILYNQDSTEVMMMKENAPSYFKQLRSFATSCVENKQMKNPAFWLTATAYLDYLAKDYDDASANLEKAKQHPPTNEILTKQIALQEMLLLVSKPEQVTPALEQQMIPLMEEFANSDNFRRNNAFVYACQRMADLYRGVKPEDNKSGGWFSGCSKKKEVQVDDIATAKAFLCTMLTASQLNKYQPYFETNTDQYSIEDTTSSATIQKVIAYFAQANSTDFDKRLKKLCGFDNDYLYTVLGRRALSEYKYATATEAFGKVNPKYWAEEPFKTYLDEDPFVLPINDVYKAAVNRYTPLSFAKKMAELETKVKANPNDAASIYLMGCGAYNMGYFGNSWVLIKRQWSSAQLNFFGVPEGGIKPPTEDDYYTSRKAWDYFEQTMKVAKDAEMASKSCFMAAKCEQNAFNAYVGNECIKNPDWYSDDKFDEKMQAIKKAQFNKFFSLLKTRYQNTQFQNEILQECGYYADYVAGK